MTRTTITITFNVWHFNEFLGTRTVMARTVHGAWRIMFGRMVREGHSTKCITASIVNEDM